MALSRAEIVGDLLDLSGFFESPDSRLSSGALEEGQASLEDLCRAHRVILRL